MKNKRIIKKNHQFQDIINKQKFLRNASFVLYYEKSDNAYFKYGISVGKKLGNAVTRNKIKKQIRVMIQEMIKTKPDFSYNFIIIARNKMIKNCFRENQIELSRLVEKFNKM